MARTERSGAPWPPLQTDTVLNALRNTPHRAASSPLSSLVWRAPSRMCTCRCGVGGRRGQMAEGMAKEPRFC